MAQSLDSHMTEAGGMHVSTLPVGPDHKGCGYLKPTQLDGVVALGGRPRGFLLSRS